jgi:competence protein ComEC
VDVRALESRLPHVAVGGAAAGLALAGVGPLPPLLLAGVVLVGALCLGLSRVAVVAAVTVAIGGLIGAARLAAIDAPAAALRAGGSVSGRANLLQPPVPGPFGASAEIELVSGAAAGTRLLARFPRHLRLPAGTQVGTELELSGIARKVDSGTEDDFDFGAHLRRRGVWGELAVERSRSTGRSRGGFRGTLDRLRRRAQDGIVAGLSPPAGALGKGMVLGDDAGISHAVRADFRDSGLGHLLAASGSNVVLLCALALPLLAIAGLSHGARIPVLLALIALYVPVAGGGPSIQRAGLMGAATLLAVALARPASRWYALALAAAVTLVLNPRACGDPGWRLSFAAVAGILLLAPGLRRALRPLPRLVADGIAITIAATVATAPLVAHHFGAVSMAGLVANVVALPLVAPIMWLGMLRAGLGQLTPEAGPLGDVASLASVPLGSLLEPLLVGMERLAALFADAPGAQLELPLDGGFAVAAAYLALATVVVAFVRVARQMDATASTAVAYLRRLPRARKAALLAATAIATALILARGLAPAPIPATLTVTFLDVGQGDATLIQHPDGSAVLFDGGPPEAGIARLLRRAGVRRLSALVMTHASRDHHGGLAEVVERFPVDLIVDGGDGSRDLTFRTVIAAARRHGVRTIAGVAPLSLRVGALRIEVLSPSPRLPGPPPDDPNPRAVVAIVSCGGFDLLLSGDAESEALLPLAVPDVDAMKVPHHGSSDPRLAELLERIRPEVASIPVGPNSYGHPAPSTLSALRDAGVMTWRNDRNGAVRLTVTDGVVEVDVERRNAVEPGP